MYTFQDQNENQTSYFGTLRKLHGCVPGFLRIFKSSTRLYLRSDDLFKLLRGTAETISRRLCAILAASGCRRYLLAAFPHFKPLQRYNRRAARVTRTFLERYMVPV